MNRVTVQITASVEAVKTMVAAAVAENHAVNIVRMPENHTSAVFGRLPRFPQGGYVGAGLVRTGEKIFAR